VDPIKTFSAGAEAEKEENQPVIDDLGSLLPLRR
jgi:hypothetical protein